MIDVFNLLKTDAYKNSTHICYDAFKQSVLKLRPECFNKYFHEGDQETYQHLEVVMEQHFRNICESGLTIVHKGEKEPDI